MWDDDPVRKLDAYGASDPAAGRPPVLRGERDQELDGGDDRAGAPVDPLEDADEQVNGSQPRRVLKAHAEARRVVREARMRADEMLREAQEEIVLLRSEAEEVRDELQDLRDELARMAEDRAAALARLEEARVTRERVEYDAGRRAARVMAQATAEAAAIRARAEQERSEAEGALQALRREHAAYEAQWGEIRARTREEIEGLRAEADVLREELDHLRTELASAVEEEARARRHLRDVKDETQRVEQAQREAERLLAGARAEADGLRAESARAQAEAQAEIDHLRATKSVSQEQVDVLRAEAQSLGEELARVRNELADTRQRGHEALQRLEELRAMSRRIEEEARQSADRLIAEARAEAGFIRSSASQSVRDTRAETDRHETMSDRLIGLQWDVTPSPDEANTSQKLADGEPPYSGAHPSPSEEVVHPALETLTDLRDQLTSEIERRIAAMAATLEGGAGETAAESPQPLIGSGGWYAGVPVPRGSASEGVDVGPPRREADIEVGRRPRGRRWRRQ